VKKTVTPHSGSARSLRGRGSSVTERGVAAAVLALQRSAGNQAVSRLLGRPAREDARSGDPTVQRKVTQAGGVTFTYTPEWDVEGPLEAARKGNLLKVTARGIRGSARVVAQGPPQEVDTWAVGFAQTSFLSNRQFQWDAASNAVYRDFTPGPRRDGDDASGFWYEVPGDDDRFVNVEPSDGAKEVEVYILDDLFTPTAIPGVPERIEVGPQRVQSFLASLSGEDDFGTWLVAHDGAQTIQLEYFPWHIDWTASIDGAAKTFTSVGKAVPGPGSSGGNAMVVAGPTANDSALEEWINYDPSDS
jgi:hypothetical protein